MTGGTAVSMAEASAEDARAELVASLCVERFMAGDNAAERLVSLKEADSWDQEDLVVEGGWVTLAAFDEPFEEAAEVCADQLVAMEAPMVVEEVAAEESATGDAVEEASADTDAAATDEAGTEDLAADETATGDAAAEDVAADADETVIDEADAEAG